MLSGTSEGNAVGKRVVIGRFVGRTSPRSEVTPGTICVSWLSGMFVGRLPMSDSKLEIPGTS